ncbi:MAG: tetratricopeptide repeat protein [Myxococcales bacterium]|nr:tetratricopeptide repeat protein [Myxococcales bacterium]
MRALPILAALFVLQLAVPSWAEPVIDSTDSPERIVTLTSGAVYRGEVIELEPKSHVILRLASGAQRRFEWRDLRRIAGTSPAPVSASRGRGGDKLGGGSSPASAPSGERPPTWTDNKVREAPRAAASYREHLNDAKVLEEVGQLADALSHYEQAYARNPQPAVLYRMASLHDQLDHPRQALTLYRRYLAQNPNLPDERQAEVATHIARLTLAVQDASSEPATRRDVDAPAASAGSLRSPGMLAAGLSIWGTSYLAAAVVGSLILAGSTSSQIQRQHSAGSIGQVQAASGVLLIPVAGPFVSSGLIPSVEWTLPWIFIGGGTQLLGMILTIAGARRHPGPRPAEYSLRGLSLGPGPGGLALIGRF